MYTLIFFVVMLGLLWVLIIRPQRQRQASHAQLVSRLRVDDEVVTAGGIYGHVRSLDDDSVRLEVAPGTEIRVARHAVAGVIESNEPQEGADEATGDRSG